MLLKGFNKNVIKQRPSLNQADINLLKKTFATKDDLKQFATKDDLKKVHKDIKIIKKDINIVIGFFDREYLSLENRVSRLENYLKIPPLTT